MRLIAHPRADVRVFPDPAALMHGAADEFQRAAEAAVAARGRFTVALAGGSTPRGVYSMLAAGTKAGPRNIRWGSVHVFFGDERAVPPDHPDSNFHMAYETLLERVPVRPANIHRVIAERPAWAAADLYEAELRKCFRLERDQRPRFDLVMLGLGADGHTASLFPGSPALGEKRRLATVTQAGPAGLERITLTLPVLNHASEVLFVVSGPGKAHRVREVLLGSAAGEPQPAQRVRPSLGRLIWMLDEAAAAELKP
jgi:6-phosphogluconolactonase